MLGQALIRAFPSLCVCVRMRVCTYVACLVRDVLCQSVSVSPWKRTPTAEVAGTVWNQPFLGYRGFLCQQECVLYERTGKTETYL